MGKRHQQTFHRGKNWVDKERNIYTFVNKLKPQQFGNNSTLGNDVNKWEVEYANDGSLNS